VLGAGGTLTALEYTLKRRAALMRCLDDGRCPIDSNLLENAIRPIAGRKNWLFAGSESAGRPCCDHEPVGHSEGQRSGSACLADRRADAASDHAPSEYRRCCGSAGNVSAHLPCVRASFDVYDYNSYPDASQLGAELLRRRQLARGPVIYRLRPDSHHPGNVTRSGFNVIHAANATKKKKNIP
jgi:hypothetical protein